MAGVVSKHKEYVRELRYVDMARERGLHFEKVVYMSKRRRSIAQRFKLTERVIRGHRLDNPFMALSAWHYMMNVAIGEAAARRERDAKKAA